MKLLELIFERDNKQVALALLASKGLSLVDLEVITHTAVWLLTCAFICVKIWKALKKNK